MGCPEGGVISAVRPQSIGEEVGLEPGDLLVSINGQPLRDLIDYRYHSADESLVFEVERQGKRHRLEIERDYDEDLGLEFTQVVFDGMRLCGNRCPFCFVQQMPKGMRPSLYVRDDDYRYSFLLGNFVTLTNLSCEDWQRIEAQRLSPLYVSIHATDPDARRRLLGNPDAPDILGQLKRLRDMGIEIHGQIVIVPGVNDGAVLRRSIEDLVALWPALRTLALVPVGLTRYLRRGVRLLQPAEAADILEAAATYIRGFRRRLGRTWLYPSDELYLLAGEEVPEAAFYDDQAQRENGVGLVRLLLDDWRRARPGLESLPGFHGITLACGTLIAPILQGMACELTAATGLDVQIQPVANQFFGATVTVSGLLTGSDVLAALAGQDLGQHLFLPRSMFGDEGNRTLDDLSPEAIAENLDVKLSLVSCMSEVLTVLKRWRPRQAAKEARSKRDARSN